jgi:hypothetical protein
MFTNGASLENVGKYDGEFKENSRHGIGSYTFADGSVYEGDWRDNVPCGKGIFRWQDGSVYDGHWKDGESFNFSSFACLRFRILISLTRSLYFTCRKKKWNGHSRGS